MRSEIERRQSLADRLAAYFEARPHRTLTHADLVAQVGENFRSRISELRKRGMVIERIDTKAADGSAGYGSYRYRSNVLGRDAATFVSIDAPLPLFPDPHPGAFQR